MHILWYALVVIGLLANNSRALQESADAVEEYIDEELPESAGDPNAPKAAAAASGAANSTKADGQQQQQPKAATNFTEDRFTQLFKPRRKLQTPQQQASPFLPKFASKAKPTLPPFIKNTQPAVRVQPSTPSPQSLAVQNQRFNQRTAVPSRTSTTSSTTTRSPLGDRRGISGIGRNRNQVTNNNSNNNSRSGIGSQPTPSPTSTTTESSRRRFGGGVGSGYNGGRNRINTNATIPATSRPRRF